ncbi:MAG: YCF48-related protein [Bacteroidota bacterium]
MRKSLIALVVCMHAQSLFGQSGWTTQTSNTSNSLTGVSFADANNGWAVGGAGSTAVIRHTTNGGGSWVTQTSPVAQLLRSVYALDANTAVAVGDNGTILRTTDSGANWTSVTSGTTNPLISVSFADAAYGWAVGSLATIKRTSNGGASWGTQTSTVSGHLRGVACASNTTVTGVGGTTDNLFQTRIRTTGGGSSWSTQVDGTVNGVVYGISYCSSTTGMMAGAGGLVYKTTDAGSSWLSVTSPSSNNIFGGSMKDANTAWVVGQSGSVYRTTDGGTNWTDQSGVTSNQLSSVSFSDLYNGTAVGTSGTIIHTTTGGVISSITAVKTGDYAGASLTPGATDLPMLQISATSSAGTAFVSALKAHFVGTCTAVDGDISALKFYNDLDNSGTVSGGDALVGSTTFSSGVATLSGLSFPVSMSGTKLLIVVDVAPGANSLHTLGVEMQDANDLTATNATSTGFPISNSSNSPLPVQVTAFHAAVEGHGVRLTWTTASEINSYGFQVEKRELRSTSWQTVGFVSGSGTSSSPREYSFIDGQVSPGRHAYRLRQIDNNGAFGFSREAEINSIAQPDCFTLEQNYPNPFNPSTEISYQLPVAGQVRLRIFDVLGNEIATLVDEKRSAGRHQILWTASGISSGMYFLRMEAGAFVDVKKLMLMK